MGRLRRLMDDFSHEERRRPGLLEEIDALLDRALNERVRTGAHPGEVRRLLGEPHLTLGDEPERQFDWLYPCLPPPATAPGAGPWYRFLRFHDGVLAATTRRSWLGSR